MFFNLQRWSLHDGPGIRTTLFFRGCPLRCRWCCNPESWAGEMAGETISPEEALDTLCRDAVFYRASGGGVTFSGGEPFLRPDVLARLADAAGMAGLGTAAETSGYFDYEAAEEALSLIDHLFVDIKCMDEGRHKDLTAVSNRRILSNIRRIDDAGKRIVIRMPLVRGLNDGIADIEAAVRFCGSLGGLAGVELMPYHPLGEGKYKALNLPYDCSMTAPDRERLDRILALFRENGMDARCTDPLAAGPVPVDKPKNPGRLEPHGGKDTDSGQYP